MNRELYDKQFLQFCEQSQKDGRFQVRREDQYPILDEDTTHTSIHYSWGYLAHCSWAARQLARKRPARHVDIGSYVYFAGIASAWVPEFIFLDFRPANFNIAANLKSEAADLTNLKRIPNNSVPSLSCMHVMEHCGLGRYGDPLDATADLKAAEELKRILAPGGELLMVLPCWEQPKIQFNAHRFYSLAMVKSMFAGLKLHSHAWLWGGRVDISPDPPRTTQYDACFVFVKP